MALTNLSKDHTNNLLLALNENIILSTQILTNKKGQHSTIAKLEILYLRSAAQKFYGKGLCESRESQDRDRSPATDLENFERKVFKSSPFSVHHGTVP